jgi:hypothetical protein
MTETEWKLQRRVCELEMALAQSQAQVCQANYIDAQNRLKVLGDAPPQTAESPTT